MKALLHLLPVFALAASANAALVTNGFVQNQAVNWTQVGGASASQSSLASGGVPARAIDGNSNGGWSGGSITHTDGGAAGPHYWEVDLGASRPITDITLFNRTDCCGGRLSNFSLLAGDDPTFAVNMYDSGNQAGAVGASATYGVSATARYIRVLRDGASVTTENVISLAEVVVSGDSLFNYANLAAGSTATQSSTGFGGIADRGVDGNLANAFGSGSTTHTADPNPGGSVFWETTLASLTSINEIAIYNRGDCCQDRLSNFRVSIFDGTNEIWGEDYFAGTGSAGSIFSIQEDAGGFIGDGDRVRIELINGINNSGTPDVLSLREVEIYGVAIPEPATASLLGLAGLALLVRRRRS